DLPTRYVSHALYSSRLTALLDAMDRLKEEAVRAEGEVLEPRGREVARAQLMACERLASERVGIDEPVGRRPAAEPAPGARAQRPGEVGVGRQQVARRARRRVRV